MVTDSQSCEAVSLLVLVYRQTYTLYIVIMVLGDSERLKHYGCLHF